MVKGERIRSMVSILNPKELWVVEMLYLHEMTQAEVAIEMGADQATVSRMAAQARAKLAAEKNFIIEWGIRA